MEIPKRDLRSGLPASHSQAWGRFCDDMYMGGHIRWYLADPVITINGRITAKEYLDILNDEVLTMTSILMPNTAIFQHDNAPIATAKMVKSWFEENQDIIKHLPWSAQLPDLNIIELL